MEAGQASQLLRFRGWNQVEGPCNRRTRRCGGLFRTGNWAVALRCVPSVHCHGKRLPAWSPAPPQDPRPASRPNGDSGFIARNMERMDEPCLCPFRFGRGREIGSATRVAPLRLVSPSTSLVCHRFKSPDCSGSANGQNALVAFWTKGTDVSGEPGIVANRSIGSGLISFDSSDRRRP